MKIYSENKVVAFSENDIAKNGQVLSSVQNSYLPAMELLYELIQNKVYALNGGALNTFISNCKVHGIIVELEADDFHDEPQISDAI
jgi:hypothetical protein